MLGLRPQHLFSPHNKISLVGRPFMKFFTFAVLNVLLSCVAFAQYAVKSHTHFSDGYQVTDCTIYASPEMKHVSVVHLPNETCQLLTYKSYTTVTKTDCGQIINGGRDHTYISNISRPFPCNRGPKINICSRGMMGRQIAAAVYANSCEDVSVSDMEQIEKIDLTAYDFGTLQKGSLDGLKNLKELKFLGVRNLEPGVFKDLKNLEYLQMRVEGRLKTGDLNGLTNLKTLNLAFSFELTTIKKGHSILLKIWKNLI